jgi:HTH-type transcriptional regulator/antitoxin HigA
MRSATHIFTVCVFAQVVYFASMGESESNFRTPGQLIESLLREKGWTQRVLAIVLKLDETGINRLVSDKRPVDAALAIALGK